METGFLAIGANFSLKSDNYALHAPGKIDYLAVDVLNVFFAEIFLAGNFSYVSKHPFFTGGIFNLHTLLLFFLTDFLRLPDALGDKLYDPVVSFIDFLA
jgi:hypothetical protein